MQFTIIQKELINAIKAINKIYNKNPHLPILSGVHLHASNNQLELTVTDLTAGLKVQIPAQITQEGQAILSGKIFIESISFFDQKETSFNLNEKDILITNGRDKVNIPVLTEEYPLFNLPTITSKSLSLSFWEKIVKKVVFATSNDQSRPALTGVLFDFTHPQLQFVGTDGFRLSVLKESQVIIEQLTENIILSAKALADTVALAQIFSLKEISFGYDQVGEQVFFITPDFTYFSKIINSNYPPYEKIIPLDFSTQITTDRENLVKNLTKASVFTRSGNNTVDLSINDQKLILSASTLNSGNFEGEQDLESHQGEDLKISFNIRYLLDFLNTCKGEVIWFGFNNPTSPAMIKDQTDEDLIYIAMPFKPKS